VAALDRVTPRIHVISDEDRFMTEPTNRHPAAPRELIQEFAVADRNNDGRVDFEEFKLLLEGLDAAMTLEEMQMGFREVDADHDGWIDCREFIDRWGSD
jgi:Ca2+-binding EF-hand superfamily protein